MLLFPRTDRENGIPGVQLRECGPVLTTEENVALASAAIDAIFDKHEQQDGTSSATVQVYDGERNLSVRVHALSESHDYMIDAFRPSGLDAVFAPVGLFFLRAKVEKHGIPAAFVEPDGRKEFVDANGNKPFDYLITPVCSTWGSREIAWFNGDKSFHVIDDVYQDGPWYDGALGAEDAQRVRRNVDVIRRYEGMNTEQVARQQRIDVISSFIPQLFKPRNF